MRGTIFLTHCARVCLVVTVTLLRVATVSASTVVMRGGRRVEIPATFVVTSNTLTYEVSPGIQVTLAIAAIDVAATEKANNETPGSLLARRQTAARSPDTSSSAMRTITNRELEPSVRRRRESEMAYENRRKQLALPTPAPPKVRTTTDYAEAAFEQKLLDDRAAEIYWRDRASALRTEIAALDGEINYVRARLDEFSFSTFPVASFGAATVLPIVSFGTSRHGRAFPNRPLQRPSVFGAPRLTPQIAGRVGFGRGATHGHVFLNPPAFSHRSGFGRRFGRPALVGHYPQIAFIGQPFDLSYERSALIAQFNELAAARAGLKARWRELEEEARRAGASPGWLRR